MRKPALTIVKTYIKTNGYVQIVRKSKMPKAMLPYYRIIIDTISHHPEMKDWYIKLGSFKDNDDFISFYLYPLPTIADSKKFDDRHQVIVDGNKITPVRLKDIR